MNYLIEFPLLIVEDDVDTFKKMERCLSTHATNRDINIKVHHAETLVDAKRKFMAYKPLVLSTDMNFPMYPKEGPRLLGMDLIYSARRRAPTAKYIVYSGDDIREITKVFANSHLFPKDFLPVMFQKNFNVSHDAWATKVLDCLYEK